MSSSGFYSDQEKKHLDEIRLTIEKLREALEYRHSTASQVCPRICKLLAQYPELLPEFEELRQICACP